MNSHRMWGIALGISLSLNVFCISALMTGWLAPPPPHHGAARGPLSEQARALFEQLSPHHQPEFRESIGAIHQQRKAVRAAFVAQPFDAKQLAAAFAALRKAEGTTATLAHQRIIDVAAKLSFEERKQLEQFVGRRPGKPRRPSRDETLGD